MTVPPEAIAAAADAMIADYPVKAETLRRLAVTALEAAVPYIANQAVRAERERIYAQLGNDHYVIFTRDRWTVEHSVECRLSGQMSECDYHAAIAEFPDDYRARYGYGRWRITSVNEDGEAELKRAESDSP